MGYVFDQTTLPKLIAARPGRERIFFVTPGLAGHDDFLAGVIRYDDGRSPYHFHTGCEHFYLLLEGEATLRTEAGERPVSAGQLVFIPETQRHQLVAAPGSPLMFMEFQGPNRFKTTILEGDEDDLRWFNEDGTLWVQT
jgi:mannose-6-phosphate isomerase-like protein (cupin superfamily)